MKLKDKIFRKFVKVQKWYDKTRKVQQEAEIVFRVDFRYEIAFMEKQRPDNKNSSQEDKPIQELSFSDFGDAIKKMRNAVARAVHPDRHGGSTEMQEEFKKVQAAFEAGNANQLIAMAKQYDVDVDLSEDSVSKMHDIAKSQLAFVNRAKKSIEFRWYHSDVKNETRNKIWKEIELDSEDFKQWLSLQNKTVEEIELECLQRKNQRLKEK